MDVHISTAVGRTRSMSIILVDNAHAVDGLEGVCSGWPCLLLSCSVQWPSWS
jgi:hypothetical protein